VLGGLIDRLLELPALAVYAVIAGLAAAENVFPPVPADSAVAVGAALSAGGRVTAWGIFLVTWVANVTSAALVYVAARTVGRDFFRGPLGRRLIRREALARIERLYHRHGTWAIFASRFIPGVRAVVPAFAGVVNLDPARALLPVGVASALWYGSLTFGAVTLVGNVGAIGAFLARFQLAAFFGGLVIIAGVVGGILVRRRHRSSPPE
jgi:membrane protein DedA with SNARE-associated domain